MVWPILFLVEISIICISQRATCDNIVDHDNDSEFSELSTYYAQNKNKVKVAHLNINSIRHKFLPISNVLGKGLLDVLFIQETKLDSSFPMSQFNVSGYKLYRNDYSANSGGIMCYVRSELAPVRHLDLEVNVDDNGRIESLVIELQVKGNKWLIYSVYKQPIVKDVYFKSILEDIIVKCSTNFKTFVIVGDLNVNVMKETHCLTELLQLYGLTNIVNEPTCIKGKSPTLIDLVITNMSRYICNVKCFDCDLSDFHKMVCFATKAFGPTKQRSKISYRSYKHFNEDEYLNDLATAPFHVGHIFDDVNDSLWFSETLLRDVIDKHAPIKTKVLKYKQVPYMNSELRRAINVRNMLKRKYDICKTKDNWTKYRNQRNLVNKLRKQSIGNYMKKSCSNISDGKEFWGQIKPLLSDRCKNLNNDIILNNNGNIVNNKKEVCHIMNDYFTSVAKQTVGHTHCSAVYDVDEIVNSFSEHKSIKFIKSLNHDCENFTFSPVSSQDVLTIMMELNGKKATGYDQIPPKLLKLGATVICGHIQYLFNACLQSSVFPSSLKCAEVCPIYKKSDTLNVSNYRPISVLTCISKIFEKLMVKQLSLHFENVWSPSMSGFRKGYNCQDVLLRLVENCKKRADEGIMSGVILTDLSKAFDTLNHALFIAKLNAYGVSTHACKFIASYFEERKQRVKLGTDTSDWLSIDMGTPQGSVMGPFCYNVFTNDLLLLIGNLCEIYNYADDNSVCCFGDTVLDVKIKLQYVATEMLSWFSDNYLKANPDKFQSILFGCNDNTQGMLNISDTNVNMSATVKLLGVYLDKDLNFNYHVNELCKRAGRKINALSRLSNIIDVRSKRILYESFVSSQFGYCTVIWNFCSVSNTKKIEKLQYRALKVIYSDYCSPYKVLLLKSELPLLYVRRLRIVLTEVYKSIYKLNPEYLHDMFTFKSNKYDMRNEYTIAVRKYKTKKYGFNSLMYQGAKGWNSLPNNIKCAGNFKMFYMMLMNWQGEACSCNTCLMCTLYNFT